MFRRSLRWAVCGLRVSLALLSAAATVHAVEPVASRVVAPVENSRTVSLPGNVHPFATRQFDRGEAAPGTPTGRIQLVFKRSAAQQMALKQYLADVQNPNSGSYHKWLKPAEYGKAFGISDADLAAVETWLKGQGFKVGAVSPARNKLEFSGTFAQVKAAFHAPIHTLAVNGERHLANVANPSVPAALAPVIAGVGPLNDFRPRSQAKWGAKGRFNPSTRKIEPELTLFSSSGTPYLYVDPADAATIYDTPNATLNPNYTGTTYDGTGVSIGVAGDSNITMQDVSNFRQAFLGETAANVNLPEVVVDGVDPGINGDEIEALLDAEIAGGLAPKAKVYLYTAGDSDLQSGLFLAIFRAIDDNQVSILNVSFGGCEMGFGTSGNELVNELMAQAAAQGISVTVSTGDSGSAGCDRNEPAAQYGLAVNGLASSPYTIGVGGTDYPALLTDFSTYVQDSSGGNQYSGTAPYYRTALKYIPETPWNDSTYPNTSVDTNTPLVNQGETNIVGGGGGASNCAQSVSDASGNITCQAGYKKPGFQTSLTPADGVRDLPDVSFLAANGLYGAVWAVCADNVALGEALPVFTDCEVTNGELGASSSVSGVGGTSAAAPAFAGMLALVEQKTGSRLGQADYVLYQLAKSKYATVFHDVTTGDNSVVCADGSPDCGSNGFLTGFDAKTGYDLATGLGSVDAAEMAKEWNNASLTSTSTSLTLNGSTAPLTLTHGETVTFNVAVNPAAATGTVSIFDNANQNPGGGPLNNGQLDIPISSGTGTATYNGLPGGTYKVFAMYGGDATDAASTSTGIDVTVTAESSTTALAVNVYAADGSPLQNGLAKVPYGSYVLQDAQIYGAAEADKTQGVATGTVKFYDNGSLLGTAAVSSADQAFLENPGTGAALGVGTHSLTAAYAGDSSFNASTSSAVSVTVVKAATSLEVKPASASISSLQSDQVQVFIDVSSVGAPPSGSVTLTDNGKTLTSTAVPGSGFVSVTLQGSSLPAGQNALTATYSGDANYAGSSASATINVTAAGFTLSNSGAVNIAAGATAGNTSTIKVAPTNGFLGVVNLSCAVTAPAGAANPATCSIAKSVDITGSPAVATALTVTTASTTTAGSYSVAVTGVDATSGKISASTAVAVTVTGGSTGGSGSFALTNGGNITVSAGATTGNTSQITATPSGGFTGAVNLSCAVTTALTNPTAPPTCSVPGSVSISGTAAATATLTVTTTAPTTARNEWIRLGKGAGIAMAGLLLIMAPKRRKLWLGLTVLLAVIATGAVGCGGGSGSGGSGGGGGGGKPGTTAGTYTVTVTGTDAATGKNTQTTAVTLTVK